MAAPVYTTDLADINTAESLTGWTQLGGGASGLGVETDYFIQGLSCVSKGGFTAVTKGQIYSAGATTITAGSAVFMWAKQNNRNLMDTVANGGAQLVIGDGTSSFDQFYVDGSDSEGSALAGWRTYAVDPTATPSATTGGGPAATTFFGMQWAILGSGSLKGSPNGIDVIRHGRELRITDGDLANGYATFAGAAAFDAATARSWGLLTPIQGGNLFHGKLSLGQAGTAVDFRDSNRSIIVLDDPFVASTFNEVAIINASSVVIWDGIQFSHLGTVAPTVLNLNVGSFTGTSCRFSRAGITTFSSTQSCTSTEWAGCGQVITNGAVLNRSTIGGYTGVANTSALLYNVATDPDGKLDNTSYTMGTNLTHAIEFGLVSPTSITVRGASFTGYGSTNNANDSVFHIKRTTGTVTINLVGCSTDGAFSYRTDGATVVVVIDPVTTLITVVDAVTKAALVGARVLLEADTGGALPAGTTIISGTTNGSGQISDLRSYVGAQPVTGRVRLSSTGGSLYKTGDIVGSISSTSGFTATVQMIPDE
jgi:hypothetical protein